MNATGWQGDCRYETCREGSDTYFSDHPLAVYLRTSGFYGYNVYVPGYVLGQVFAQSAPCVGDDALAWCTSGRMEIDHEKLYAPDEHEALRYLYAEVRLALRSREYERVGRWLSEVDLARASGTLLVGWLTVTLPWGHLVPGRDEFYEKVHAWAVANHPNPERLLRNLGRKGVAVATQGHNALMGLLGRDEKIEG